MENPIIVPFDLNTARKIKSGEIEGSVLIGNIKIEFVYESKDCADRYNLLFDLESQIREVLKRCLSYKIVEEVPVFI